MGREAKRRETLEFPVCPRVKMPRASSTASSSLEKSFVPWVPLSRSGGEVSVVGGGAEKPEGTVSLLDAR